MAIVSTPAVGPLGGPAATETTGSTHWAQSTATLLRCGVAASPLFTVAALIQVFTRPGFDLTRQPLSALSNGDWGWVQILNFVVTGVLLIAGGQGLGRVLRGRPGRVWAPLLLDAVGFCLLAAGPFRMDPANGFPSGTPDGMPATMSWHSTLHMVFGSLAFLSLIALCFVLARSLAARRQRGFSAVLAFAGFAFASCLVESATGGPAGSLWLFVGVVAAMLAVSATAARFITLSPAP
jgi:Protein of unknown function (DUF998)